MDRSTIAAVATPVGRGGIGIIRISGPEALAVAKKIFLHGKTPKDQEGIATGIGKLPAFHSHRMVYGHIIDPLRGHVVDEVMLVAMKAPRSYTREDVVEIHSHSGPAILNQVLEMVLGQGIRLADPGEFTRRAFLNGRIDLSQAEAVIDVINAQTATSLSVASKQLQGEIRVTVESWRQTLKETLAVIEGEIEFGDETGHVFDLHGTIAILKQKLYRPIQASIKAYDQGHILRDGLRIVVIGRPNVGKSSLLNRLIKKERAIVTALPGTTRDSIEETLSIKGIPAVITDTAGLHPAVEPAEVLGIRKTHEYISQADLILFMIAADDGILKEDLEIYQQVKTRPLILVVNKTDLSDGSTAIENDTILSGRPTIAISAKFNQGIDGLKALIVDRVMKDTNMIAANHAIPKLRHKKIFEESLDLIQKTIKNLQSGLGSELAVADLQKVYDLLGRVLGENTGEDILDEIFGRFCIGK